MLRFLPSVGVIAALVLGASAIVYFSNAPAIRAPTTLPTLATSTLSDVRPKTNVATTSLTPAPSADGATSPEDTSTQTAIPAQKKKITPSVSTLVPLPLSVPVIPTAPLVSESAALDTSASALRAALVNIFCRVVIGGGPRLISGSGIFIDSQGIVLTNAHIAEHFLLADRGATCTIRSGSPASNRYKAALIFISPAWIRANADVIGTTAPSGTGEHDFALLAVTKSVTEDALPASFPSVPLATLPLRSGAPVVIGSYGAQFLDQNQLQSALFPTIVFGSVKDVYTFGTSTIDVLALGGSVAAQEGSSGGGVIDVSGMLTGVITTSTVEGATDTRFLNAITASYIRADYVSETGQSLDLLFSTPTAVSIANFAPHIPALEAIVTAHL